MDSKTTLIVVAVITLVVGAGVGYYAMPPKIQEKIVEKPVEKIVTQTVEKVVPTIPLAGKTLTIAQITGTQDDLTINKPAMEKLVLPEINAYLKALGYNTQVQLKIDTAGGQAAGHLEKLQAFKAQGYEIVYGAGWSSMIAGSLAYANQNKMMLTSTGSTSPTIAIPDDNLFRLCPNDLAQGILIPKMINSMGIKAIVAYTRGDTWGDGIFNIFEKEYLASGGEILKRMRYESATPEFSNYLQSGENALAAGVTKYGADKVAVLWIEFGDNLMVPLSQAKDYPSHMKVLWFGAEEGGRSQKVIKETGTYVVPLHIFSALMGTAPSPKFDKYAAEYFKEFALLASFYSAALPDMAWTLTLAQVETQSTNALDIIRVYPRICNNYFGVSGWCTLDASGDRVPGLYNIWGYAMVDGKMTTISYGTCNGATGVVTWDKAVLASQGVKMPS